MTYEVVYWWNVSSGHLSRCYGLAIGVRRVTLSSNIFWHSRAPRLSPRRSIVSMASCNIAVRCPGADSKEGGRWRHASRIPEDCSRAPGISACSKSSLNVRKVSYIYCHLFPFSHTTCLFSTINKAILRNSRNRIQQQSKLNIQLTGLQGYMAWIPGF